MLRFFSLLVFGASVAAAIFFSVALYEIFCERSNAANRVGVLADDVASMKRRAEYQKDFHSRFINDEAFASRVIREALGYSAEGEIIFKFDEKTFSADGTSGVRVERASNPLR